MMRLKSRRFSSKRVGILSTLILVLALAIQPLSPMVMRIAHASLDPAETTPSSPSLGSLAPVLWDGDNYKGINIDLSLKDITGLSSFTATIHRVDGSTVVKTMKQLAIDWLNSLNGKVTPLTLPFVIQALTYNEAASGAWSLPSTTIWTSASVPQSVTVDMTFADSSKNFTKTSPINTRGIDYLSLLPVSSNPHTTIVAPTGIVGNKFTVSGLATDDEALNRVYVQLVYRGDSQRYGGKTINLIGKGAEPEWSHEFDAVKLNLPDGQYAAHAQVVDMKGNRYDTGWTENFTVDRTGPAISNVAPVTGTNVNADFTVSANVSDPNGVKKVALYVYDQATNTKVKEYPLSNTKGDIWTAQVKLADLRGDAVYDLRFRAVDNLNNVTYHNNRGGAYLVTVDRTSPAFSNIEISPMINGNIGGTVRIAVDLTDDSGVDTNIKYTFIRFFANNREYSYEFTKVAGNESTYEAIVNTRDFVRTNTFAKVNASLRFQDVLGNGRSTKPEVLQGVGVDNSGPGSRLVSPSGDAIVRDTTRFVVEATDHTGTKSGYIKVNGQKYDLAKAEAEDGYWYADVDTTSWSDGSYRVEARLVDLFGQPRYNSNIGSVQVDNTTPTITVKDDYVGDKEAKIFSKISFKLFDANMADKYSLNGTVRDFTNNRWSDANYDNIKGLLVVQGENELVLYDVAGNSANYVFTYDSEAPTGRFTYSNNNGNALTRDDVTVTLNTSEAVATPEGWHKQSDKVFTRVFDNNGKYDVTIVDLAGNQTKLNLEVKRIDRNAPTVSGVSDGTVVKGPVTLTIHDPKYQGFDGFDANHGLTVNGQKVATQATADKNYLYVISREGAYEVVATDKAGNSTSLSFVIDQTAPVVSLKTVEKADGSRDIVASIADANLSHYWFTVTRDGVDVNLSNTKKRMEAEAFSDKVLATLSQPGEYVVKLEARDKAGNKDGTSTVGGDSVKTLSFTITAPSDEGDDNSDTEIGNGQGENADSGQGGDGNNPPSAGGGQTTANGSRVTPVPVSAVINSLATTTLGNFGFAPVADAAQPEADDEDVLAEEDNRLESELGSVLDETDNAMENADREDSFDFMKFLGDWWWLILLGILTLGLIWWFIAWRRRKDEEEQ